MTDRKEQLDFIVKTIESLRADFKAAERIVAGTQADDKDQKSATGSIFTTLTDDLEKACAYIFRDSNLSAEPLIDLYSTILSVSRKEAAKKLHERCVENRFKLFSEEDLPAVLNEFDKWDGKLKSAFADHGLATEIMGKKLLLLFMEIGTYIEDIPHTKKRYEKFMDALTDSYEMKKILRQGHYGPFGYEYNKDLTHHDLRTVMGVVKEEKSSEEEKEDVISKRKAELAALTGLEDVKAMLVEDFLAMVLARQILKEQYKEEPPQDIPHLVFSGGPGTGKTTIGEIAADLLWAYDVLPERKFKRVTRPDLVGKYIGHTEAKTRGVLESILGGVIFIDEVHNLWAAEEDTKDYAHEVVGEFVNFLEHYKNQFVAIIGGYEEGTKRFLAMDDGMSSRFPIQMQFPNYSREQLTEIFNGRANLYGITLADPQQITQIMDYLEDKKEKSGKSFGNAREVRNLVARFQTAVYSRLFKAGSVPSQREIANGAVPPPLADLRTVREEDIRAVLDAEKKSLPAIRKMGF